MTNVKNVKNGELYQLVIDELKIRTNARGETFAYDINQTREKFKRCIKLCKEALMIVKTKSGISRFQESKELGAWFPRLLQIVSTMDSAQPDQAIEPSASCSGADKENVVGGKRRKDCMVTHEGSKKKAKSKYEQGLQEMREMMRDLRDSMREDPTKDLVKLLQEEAERQAHRDDVFLRTMSALLCAPANTYYSHASHQSQNDWLGRGSARGFMGVREETCTPQECMPRKLS